MADAKDSLLKEAIGLYNKDRNRAALDIVQRALQIDSNFAAGYNLRGLIYMALSEHESALADLNTVIRLDPAADRAHYDRIWFHILIAAEKRKQTGIKL